MRRTIVGFVWFLAVAGFVDAASTEGYYRQPALRGATVVFVAEGDLWKVHADGGVAERLTTHPAAESLPAISPDGSQIAFVARYEGPAELYTMPLDGGMPTRRTYGRRPVWVGWTPQASVLYATRAFSDLPNAQLVQIEERDGGVVETRIPLAQAADGDFSEDGTLWFTRLPFQGSHTKRYRGGTAQQIWRFSPGDEEATPLTRDYPGTSKRPMLWNGRVYFASDRDGTMNLWSMQGDGADLTQHTRHDGWDVKSPSLDNGRIAYQLGADLHLYDVATDTDKKIDIRLRSDFDHMRENWVDEPMDYVSSIALSVKGDQVALTARGRVYVIPTEQGRLVEAGRQQGVRFRQARFHPDGERLVVLSDASGEVEVWTLPADGVGDLVQLTDDGEVLRWEVLPSPDGKWAVHHDKNQRLWLLDLESRKNVKIDESAIGDLGGLAWSPDSRFLAYVKSEENMFSSIRIYDRETGRSFRATTDRYDSSSPFWSPDGKWLYFLSDRNLVSIVGSPWGNYQPEPFLDKKTQIFMLALTKGLRSPFAPADELHEEEDEPEKKEKNAGESGKKKSAKRKNGEVSDESEKEDKEVVVTIDVEGLTARLHLVPVSPGNYRALGVTEKALFWLSRAAGENSFELVAAPIQKKDVKIETVASDIRFYDLSADGKKLLLRVGDKLHVVDAKPKSADLKKTAIDLDGWKLSIDPREEWRQMFVEAWRLERDYFYDQGMHGVNWPAMLEKYLPLVRRVTDRAELSDLMAQMVSELAALHIFFGGGDQRDGPDEVDVASLGARLIRDAAAGGYRVEHIYRSDPDDLSRVSPLARPGIDVSAGAVIEKINGRSTLEAGAIGALLRNQAGRQVLLHVRDHVNSTPREVVVTPIGLGEDYDLRYHEWEYTRRLEVDEKSDGDIGYVHLRAMGGRNFTEWAKNFYPAFNRKGLIVDVRHNRGGNIDSWILSRLMRRPWFYWSQRVGQAPAWNQQYAFRGHVVVLCNERTASDGEAFSEGFRRLGLGPVIGTRTWGGEIWLTSSNRLVDGGIATAAEFGVYGPEGEWLIEGWGVEPDIVVDNLPHATFQGEDAQLQAAIDYLRKKIAEEPVD
ncbi:MAG: PD40 domain-containing protein, partial [Acidobacteria bacterium]|nr:PD40 domain-containing protein [Acidobacteriota bacterium]